MKRSLVVQLFLLLLFTLFISCNGQVETEDVQRDDFSIELPTPEGKAVLSGQVYEEQPVNSEAHFSGDILRDNVIDGALVCFIPIEESTISTATKNCLFTNREGYFKKTVTPGNYLVEITVEGFMKKSKRIYLGENKNIKISIGLMERPFRSSGVEGRVFEKIADPEMACLAYSGAECNVKRHEIIDARVCALPIVYYDNVTANDDGNRVSHPQNECVYTSVDGYFNIPLDEGDYKLFVTLKGYEVGTKVVHITDREFERVVIELIDDRSPPTVVKGLVVDPDNYSILDVCHVGEECLDEGEVSGARVCVFQQGTKLESYKTAFISNCMTTGRDGRFKLRVAPGQNHLIVSKKGFEDYSSYIDLVEGMSTFYPIDLVSDDADTDKSQINGTVFDEMLYHTMQVCKEGDPCPEIQKPQEIIGAKVCAVPLSATANNILDKKVVCEYTDKQGKFSLLVTNGKKYRLQVSVKGFVNKEREISFHDKEAVPLVFHLNKDGVERGSIIGKVTVQHYTDTSLSLDESIYITGANVCIFPTGVLNKRVEIFKVDCTYTDHYGKFEFHNILGDYGVKTFAKYYYSGKTFVLIEEGEKVDLEVSLMPAFVD